jgi:serine/threonine protein kinase
MLFPLADCDLYTFWETHDGPLMDGSKASSPVDDMFWITTQITGLVSALTVIHNVGSAYHPNRGFGRHGDIKADNILCLQSCTNPRGTLVLSDFGLSSSHKETTQLRKSKDTVTIAFTPAYRPPECDIDLPKPISRLSDIWNLGCLLLEMACWILGGKDELTRFHSIRTVVSAATGAASSVYFEVKQTEGKNFEFRIKREVTNVGQLSSSTTNYSAIVFFPTLNSLTSILQHCTVTIGVLRTCMTYSMPLNSRC